MALVKRANSERIVPEEKVKEFLELGYSLIDEKGNVLKKGKAQSKEDLLVAYNEANAEIAALKDENKALKDENANLKAELDKLKDGEGDKFKCPYCDKEYASQSALDKHIKRDHPDKLGGENEPE